MRGILEVVGFCSQFFKLKSGSVRCLSDFFNAVGWLHLTKVANVGAGWIHFRLLTNFPGGQNRES